MIGTTVAEVLTGTVAVIAAMLGGLYGVSFVVRAVSRLFASGRGES